jgi:hypothetical protein
MLIFFYPKLLKKTFLFMNLKLPKSIFDLADLLNKNLLTNRNKKKLKDRKLVLLQITSISVRRVIENL